MSNQDKHFSDNEVKHLEMIQAIIARMGQNSFVIKGLTITLFAGTFALLEKGLCSFSFCFLIIPIVFLWFLDSYYLRKERQYRKLYNMTRIHKVALFDMSISNVNGKHTCYLCCLFSKTEWVFYLTLILSILIIQNDIVAKLITLIKTMIANGY
jgi:hypothetical protein